jgi:hypothetical protein
MSLEHVLKNSSVADRRPTAAQLANGEISLNWNAAGPFICCKDSAGNVQQIAGVKIGEAEPPIPVRGTTWLKPSIKTLFIHTGTAWESVAGGGGGAPAPPGGTAYTFAATSPITVSTAGTVAPVVTIGFDMTPLATLP